MNDLDPTHFPVGRFLLPDHAPSPDERTLGELRLDSMLALYAWHGRHHVAHVTTLRERAGW